MDYEKLGLKAGIEIHQQLNTKEKLFSHTPTIICDSSEHTGEVKRYLRSVTSESGDIDVAAKEELIQKKLFTYYTYDTTGLVEIDEQPPCPMNTEALDIVLTIAKMFNMTPLPQINVMRKMIVDGSNTSGFQRTALVALNGNSKDPDFQIDTVTIEEDACQRVDDHTFSVDRLGIPLIEITTSPCMRTPDQVHDVAQYIGMILRSTGRVKRGLGTIRQDINISIKDGARVEIKGVQELDLIPEIVKREIQRQISLIKIRTDLINRHASVPDIDEVKDVTDIFANTTSRLLKNASVILGIKLPGFSGIVGREIQPGRRLGSELSDYAKKCGVGGLLHTDELPGYGITENEVNTLRSKFNATNEDAIIIVSSPGLNRDRNHVSPYDVCMCAMKMIIHRAKMSMQYVPEETRKVLENGSTAYMRPLPGAARMYPETDILPIYVSQEYWDDIKLPELLISKISRFESEYGFDEYLAHQIVFSERLPLFERAVSEGIRPVFASRTILASLKEVCRVNASVDNLTDDCIIEVMKSVESGIVAKEAIIDVLSACANGKSVSESIKLVAPAFSEQDLRVLVNKIVTERSDFIKTRGNSSLGPIMGVVMKEVRGRIDGNLVSKVVAEEINKILL
ncbi:MAG TPA: Glu-tRNA(Gln) amidotransferase subunit GatE [Methanocorpusculum sp.]|nr:Glu-tRNA(Gln) amidotransferase subunit GatE [Methanocorpusculum sp.]